MVQAGGNGLQRHSFTTGRVQFLKGEQTPEGTSPLGQAFTYFGDRAEEFGLAFENVGLIFGPPVNYTNRALPAQLSPASTVAPVNNPKLEESVKELFLKQPTETRKARRLQRALHWRAARSGGRPDD
jgi:hypothetical protein